MEGLDFFICSKIVVTDTCIEDVYVLEALTASNSSNIVIENAVIDCSSTNVSEASKAYTRGSIYDRYSMCLPTSGISFLYCINISLNAVDINFAFRSGIAIAFSSFTTITNINITNIFERIGVGISNSTNTDISQIIIADVMKMNCIALFHTTNTTVTTSYLINCDLVGIIDYRGSNVSLKSTTISNALFGMVFYSTKSTFVDTAHISSTYIGAWITHNAANITFQRMFLDTYYGFFIHFSSHIFLFSVVANATDAGVVTTNSSDVSVEHCTIMNTAYSPIIIKNSYDMNVSNLTLSFSYSAQFQIFLSGNVSIQNVYTDGVIAARNVRLLIGNSTNVFINNISFDKNGNNPPGQEINSHIDIIQSTNVVMRNVSFTEYSDIDCYSSTTCFTNADSSVSVDARALHSVVYIQSSKSVTFENCSFSDNNLTALKVVDSSFAFSGSVNFTNNRATRGAAIILSQRSYMTITDNATIIFRDNTATLTGGAIHLDGYRDEIEDFYEYNDLTPNGILDALSNRLSDEKHIFEEIESVPFTNIDNSDFKARWFHNEKKFSHCFLKVNSSEATLMFVNNTAAWGGNVLYGGNLAWECITHNHTCVDSCLVALKNVSYITPQDSFSQITSDPLRVCLCNSQNKPDCTIVSRTLSAYPGQTITIKAVVAGQDFGTVRGPVYAHFLEQPQDEMILQMELGQSIQLALQQQCNKLDYTILSKRIQVQNVTLVLATSFQKVYHYVSDEEVSQAIEEYNSKPYTSVFSSTSYDVQQQVQNVTNTLFSDKILHFPVYLDIILLQCPPGFTLRFMTAKCDCNAKLQKISGITCNIDDYTIEHSGPIWIGTANINHSVIDLAIALYCPFDFCKSGRILLSINSSQSDDQCNYNHSGILCGGCQPGLSLAVGSSKCLQCSNSYLSLLLPLAVAGIALVFFIKTLNFTVSSGTINGLVFYANIAKANEPTIFPHQESNVLTVFISWINLDVGVETCFVDGFTAYWKTWMQFMFPLYVWTIAGCIIISTKYSRLVAKMMGNNSVPVLATLFLLSYAKLLRSVITILQYSVLEYSSGQKLVWSADGNLDYLGPQHIPLFAAAVAALLFLWLPYTLLLFSGQWIHKCNFRLINSLMMKIKPLLDAYYGPLEDKHRYWFGALLLMRAVILLISALVPSTSSNITMLIISTCSAILVVAVNQKVYRNAITTLSETLFLLNLILLTQARLFSISSGGNQTLAAHLLVGVAFLQFVLLVLLAAYKRFREARVCVAVRACVHREQEADDEMELLQLADADREVDMDSVSTESSDCDSQPTY